MGPQQLQLSLKTEEDEFLRYDPNLHPDLGGVPDWCRVDFKCAPSPSEVAGMRDRGEFDLADWPMLAGMSPDFCAMKMLQRVMTYVGCDAAIATCKKNPV